MNHVMYRYNPANHITRHSQFASSFAVFIAAIAAVAIGVLLYLVILDSQTLGITSNLAAGSQHTLIPVASTHDNTLALLRAKIY